MRLHLALGTWQLLEMRDCVFHGEHEAFSSSVKGAPGKTEHKLSLKARRKSRTRTVRRLRRTHAQETSVVRHPVLHLSGTDRGSDADGLAVSAFGVGANSGSGP